MRAALAVAGGALAYGAVSYSFAQAIRTRSPERAHRLAPWDGRVAAYLSEKMSGPDASAADRARADMLAREAIREDPTAVSAYATLGLNAGLAGDAAAAQRLFGYARFLSRRDLRTQIWAVEDSVSRGDVTGALHAYDVALRTSRAAPDLMFPVLASAIADPAVRAALIKTLAGKPIWAPAFLSYLAEHVSDPVATAALFRSMQERGVPVLPGASAAAINALIQQGLFDGAWNYYAFLRPGASRSASRDPRFTGAIDYPSLLDWVPTNDDAVNTSIQHGDQGGVFEFSAPSSQGGTLLRQMQMLPAGRYRLEGHSNEIDQPPDSRPYWVLTCLDGHELGRVAVPNSAEANGNFAGSFDVPANCPVQYLALVARPSEAVSGLSGQIDRVALRPGR